jgi:hypothetical protein
MSFVEERDDRAQGPIPEPREDVKDRVVRIIFEYPDRIAKVLYDLTEYVHTRDSAKNSKAILESGVAHEVSSEEDESGKKRYSNETARKAELTRRLKANEKWLEIDQAIEDHDLKAKMAEIEYERLKRTHSGAIALTRIIGGNEYE